MIKKLLTVLFISSALFTSAQTGLTNLDFEYWTGSEPTGFFGFGGISQQTTGAQNGTYYARISVTVPSGPTADGIMILGTPPATLGAPYALRPYSIDGYYRCFFAGPDTMAIAAGLSLNGNDVAPLDFLGIYQAQSAWTQFSLPFNYVNGNNPDTMAIIFYANTHYINNSDNTLGSYLDLDNVSINMTSGVVPYTEAFTHIQLYPNPATDVLTVGSPELGDNTAVEIYNALGERIYLLQHETRNQEPVTVNVSALIPGVYFVHIIGQNKQAIQKLVVQR